MPKKKNQGQGLERTTSGWILDRWQEPSLVPPTRGREGRGCPLASFLAAASGEDPLFQIWSRSCLHQVATMRCTEDPGRAVILQSAACLQALHYGVRLYRTRTQPVPGACTLADAVFQAFLEEPVFLRFPTLSGNEAVAIHAFERGDQYQVEFDGTTRFQIITDRSVVLVALLREQEPAVVLDVPPGELRWALADDALAPAQLRERPESLAAIRSLARNFGRN